MAQKILYWSSIVLAGLALVLFLANATLISRNQKMQAEVASRQSTMELFTVLSPLNQNLAQIMAQSAVKNHDEAMRELLASQGITINNNEAAKEAPKAPAAPAADAAKTDKK